MNTHPPALEVQGLTRTHGSGPTEVTALDAVDLSFSRGSFTAIMGPSGSGKSTLLNCAACLDRPTTGRVMINGTDVTDWNESRRTRLRREQIGFVFQDYSLMPYLTAKQNVELPIRLAGRGVDASRVSSLLERMDLADLSDRLPSALSGGQRQRVALARALVTEPAVLLADEPTGALDNSTAHEVLGLLRASVDELGQTIVMVTHDAAAAAYADAVLFLVDRRIVGRMHAPTIEAIAAQMAHLDDLSLGAAR
jgi:putative ABC transport system ATP-binding protein